MTSRPVDPSMDTVAPRAPITRERKLNENLQNELQKPHLARAQAAADKFHPKGTEGRNTQGMTVLQQHVAFFDRNNDGAVYSWETYQGFRAIGCNFFLSITSAFLINFVLSYSSQPNIHRCKHGSDSETYDTEGRFEPSKFEAIFSKYAGTIADALSESELRTMLKANRNLTDFNGWLLSYTEWQLLYTLGKDERGFLHRETIRGVYDGSLFEQLEKARASRSKRA